MIIYLHNISCDAIVLDKTSYLSATPQSTTAYLKASENDLLYLTIIIDTSFALTSFNYLYISDLSSYYFVSRRKILDNNRYQLELEKDVLFSNLTKIKNSYAIINRSDNNGQIDIADPTDEFGDVENESKTDLTAYKVSEFNVTGMDYLVIYYDGHKNDTTNYPESTFGVNLIITYDDGVKPSTQYGSYALETANITNINMRVLNWYQLQKLSFAVGNDSNLLSCIIGIYKIPIATSATDNLKFKVKTLPYVSLYLGTQLIDLNYDDGVTKVRCPYELRSRWVFESFKLFTADPYKHYYFQNPYHKYEIWCPFVGWVEIPAKNIINRSIKIFYTFDLLNGESTCNFYDTASETVFMTKQANAFLQVPLSALNMREMEERKTSLILNTIIGGVSSAVAVVGGAYTGNAMAVAGGVISASKVASNAITGFTQLHPSANVNVQNSNSGYQMKMTFVLKETYKSIYRQNRLGRPCNISNQTLSTQTGYFQATHLILSDGSGLCKDEVDKIKLLIEKGVIMS